MSTLLPIIRMELEGMRYAVNHAFNAHLGEIKEIVEEETKRVIEGFDFAEAVRRELAQIIPEMIHVVIKENLRKALTQGETRNEIDRMVQNAVKDVIEEMR